MTNQAHRIGAIFYVVWGALHIMAARGLYGLAGNFEPGIVQARMEQAAFHMLFFAVAAIVVAVLYNWKNSRLGYWLNLILISTVDIGFIARVLAPGWVPVWPAALGPVLWLLGLGFTTLGLGRAEKVRH